MEHSYKEKTSWGLWFDWPFIFRTIRRWILPILSLASMLMVATYIVMDMRLQDSCTVSAIVAVVPREYTNNNLSDNTNNNAVTRNVNMWNSNSMMKVIMDLDRDIEVEGSLHATAVSNTNLVKVEATATTSQNAYYILTGAIGNYRKIVSNFDNTHLSVVMTDTSKSEVSVIKPSPLKYAVLIFSAVFLGGLGVLCLWTLVTSLLHCEEQANGLLEVPVYEALPKVKKNRDEKALLITNPGTALEYLEAVDRCASRVGQHMLKHGQKILMITSVCENEGKTTIATNLAINLARKGNRILLIDMDFRRPSIVKLLDQERDESKNCSHGLELGEKLEVTVVHREDLGNLDVIFQYNSVPDADQFLETTKLTTQLKELAELYDYVIIDTAPMGPVRDADVIAQRADVSLLVVREEVNHASVINDVTDQLDEFGAHCMGIALNQCSRKRKSSFSKTGYSYRSYSYGKERRR